VFLDQHVQKEQRELGSYKFQEVLSFLVSECPHISFSFAIDIGRLEAAHSPHKILLVEYQILQP
jgi:hypothetical protein